MSAYYAFHRMREDIKDEEQLLMPTQNYDHATNWAKKYTLYGDEDIITEFYQIQIKLGTIIYRDVYLPDGLFKSGVVPPKDEVDKRLQVLGDTRPFLKFCDMPTMTKK